MEDYGFPIGSRVVLVRDDPCGYVEIGMMGVVCDIDNGDTYLYNCKIGVRWEQPKINYHDCCGRCEPHHGRYVPPDCLELINLDFGEIETGETDIYSLFI